MPNPADHSPDQTHPLLTLLHTIVSGEDSEALRLLEASPSLAREPLTQDAEHATATNFFFQEINHYLYAGDTPLHAAAAGYRIEIARTLLRLGADINHRNRRGAEPIHYAADGSPSAQNWNPQAQAAIITLLIQNGANPNTLDKSGVAPLHRAVRQRCTGAVEALLKDGARVQLKNKSGSTPMRLAALTTGKSGSGSHEAKACQQQIIQLLLTAGADPNDLHR